MEYDLLDLILVFGELVMIGIIATFIIAFALCGIVELLYKINPHMFDDALKDFKLKETEESK